MEKKVSKKTLQRYRRVIDAYFNNGFHGRDAYMSIYKNVTKETASVNFNKIRKIAEVQDYENSKREKAAKIIDITHEGLLQELKNWIEADLTKTICLTPDEVKKLPVEVRRLISECNVKEVKHYDKGRLHSTTTTMQLKFVSKEKAMEMIAKHIGFYEIDNRQKSKIIDLESSTTDELLMRAKALREIEQNDKSGI